MLQRGKVVARGATGPAVSNVLADPRDPPRIWIRHSQIKIKYPISQHDPAHYVVDVLRSSHLTSPAHLSSETIINFAENGVNPQVFCRLMELAINARVSALLDWEGEDGCKKLWNKVAEEGGVFSARVSRLFPGIARVLGQIRDDKSEEWEDEDGLDQIDVAEHSVAWWADPISGSPSSLEETVMRLLDAGFSPSILQVLRDKLREVAFKAIRTCVQKFHIQVPESCTAFVIPGDFLSLAFMLTSFLYL